MKPRNGPRNDNGKKISTKIPLPLVVVLEAHGAQFLAPITSPWFGPMTRFGRIRKTTPFPVVRQILSWLTVQRERKRMGLPYLESEEMELIII